MTPQLRENRNEVKTADSSAGAFSRLSPNIPTNLPALRARLIGREKELDEIRDLLLRDDVNLLTLAGLGGAGKTTLALHSANLMLESFPEGVFFVNLAPISHPDQILVTIAQTLNVPEQAEGSLLESLRDFLGSRPHLLVLDNLEQLMDGVTQIGALLDSSKLLKILATSREALRLRGEQVFPVDPLSNEYAVELFAQRARSLNPEFSLTDENRSAVYELCRRLDRLPLAIELAALRTRLFSPQTLLDLFQRDANPASPVLDLLSDGARDLPPRQQTLRDTIAWSYSLLSPSEQGVLRACSVFPAEFGLHAMQSLSGQTGTGLLSILSSLVDKNLLQPGQVIDGEPRFAMLETIREFSLEQARSRDEWDGWKEKLTAYYAEFTGRATLELKGDQSAVWFRRLDAEYPNLTAVMEWTNQTAPGSEAWKAGLTILGNLRRYWMLRGHFHFANQWIEQGRAAIESFAAHPTADTQAREILRLKAGIYALSGGLYWALGEYETSKHWNQASYELYEQLQDDHGMADALNDLAVGQDELGEHAEAFENHQRGIRLHRKIGDQWGEIRTINNMSRSLEGLDRTDEALTSLQEGLRIAETLKDQFFIASFQCNIANIYIHLGRHSEAIPALEQCLANTEALEYPYLRAWTLAILADARLGLNEREAAAQALRDCLLMTESFGDNNLKIEALTVSAALCAAAGKPDAAAKIMSSLDTMLVQAKGRRTPYDQAEYEALIRQTRLQQSKDRFEDAWARGRSMPVKEALAFASKQIDEQLLNAAREDSLLTVREKEVLLLLSKGKSNDEIAGELVVVVKTVEKHVGNILLKLGVKNRTEAAAWAMKNGANKK
jgi:predicted ATPase/DNA-binding CsgD family transcriptional regulator